MTVEDCERRDKVEAIRDVFVKEFESFMVRCYDEVALESKAEKIIFQYSLSHFLIQLNESVLDDLNILGMNIGEPILGGTPMIKYAQHSKEYINRWASITELFAMQDDSGKEIITKQLTKLYTKKNVSVDDLQGLEGVDYES